MRENMNKIKVVENKIIPFVSNDVKIDNNIITFINNGNYCIDYIDCDCVNITIKLEDSVNRNSSLILSKFSSNGTTNEKINIYLNGDKANIKYNFSSISNHNDKYTINIYHKKDNTISNIFNRTIAKEGSSNIFDINSYVDNGIKNCYLNQQTKIITLGDSNNKINPNMFISEDSTTAIHSSVIGNISEDELFYLMSRGINYKDSLNLLIKGIILSNINVDIEYIEKILRILDKLGGE